MFMRDLEVYNLYFYVNIFYLYIHTFILFIVFIIVIHIKIQLKKRIFAFSNI